jgi:hypothetical protein
MTIAGAYFPAWLLCGIAAVVFALIVRVLIVASGLTSRVPYQLAVCSSLGGIAALIIWRLWVVH